MSDIIRLHGEKHSDIQELLPWYAVGTLEPQETAVVEAHLERCADCKAELALDLRLRGAIGDLPLDVERGWAALRRVIDRAPVARKPSQRPFLNAFAFFSRPLKLGWFLGAQAAFALMALAIVGHPPAPMPYRALATPRSAASGNAIVIFRDDAREQVMRAALLASGARVIDGPTPAGAYILIIPVNRDLGLARLRGTPAVALAEPLDLDKPL